MNIGTTSSWAEVAKTQGVAWMLLIILIGMNSAALKQIFDDVPKFLITINEGYEKNSRQLKEAAKEFSGASLQILTEYKKDREIDQQTMIELIRVGDLNSGEVAEAFERAQEKTQSQGGTRPSSGSD
jgi:hypothetical protein